MFIYLLKSQCCLNIIKSYFPRKLIAHVELKVYTMFTVFLHYNKLQIKLAVNKVSG